MRLFPELATCHDVSIPELLASRDERQARQNLLEKNFMRLMILFDNQLKFYQN